MVICTGDPKRVETTCASPEAFLEEILAQPFVEPAVETFLKRQRCSGEPRHKTIQVLQGECAHVRFEEEEDGDMVLESTAATTCVIAVAMCRTTACASVAHFDEPSAAAFTQWLGDMTHPTVYLLGDFELPGRHHVSISAALLWFLHRHATVRAEVGLACVRRFNTRPDGWPVSYALSFDCTTDTAFPELMDEETVPGAMERAARSSSVSAGKVLVEVYDERRRMLFIRSVRVRVPRNLSFLQGLEDKDLLQFCSTSPLHEPPNFVPDLRARWDWMASLSRDALVRPEQWFEWTRKAGWRPAVLTEKD